MSLLINTRKTISLALNSDKMWRSCSERSATILTFLCVLEWAWNREILTFSVQEKSQEVSIRKYSVLGFFLTLFMQWFFFLFPQLKYFDLISNEQNMLICNVQFWIISLPPDSNYFLIMKWSTARWELQFKSLASLLWPSPIAWFTSPVGHHAIWSEQNVKSYCLM